jgi:hypothetical protein
MGLIQIALSQHAAGGYDLVFNYGNYGNSGNYGDYGNCP